MSPVVAMEPFTAELFQEIVPLGQKCWDESTQLKGPSCAYYGDRDFDIKPDFGIYEGLAKAGALVVITVRSEGKLVGYMCGFTHRSLHHSPILCAVGDSIYLEPEFRSYTPLVAVTFETEMQKRGVNIIGWPTQEDGPVFGFLKAMGYVVDDVVMEKRLCAS